MKKIIKLIIVVLFCFTISVKAETRVEEAERKLTNFTFNYKTVDLSENISYIASLGSYNEEDIRDTYYDRLVYNDINKLLNLTSTDGMDISCYLTGETYWYYDEELDAYNEAPASQDMCQISVYFDMFGEDEMQTYSTTIYGNLDVVEGNANYKTEALNIVKSLSPQVFIGDVDLINHRINYDADTSTTFNNETATKEFSEIKKVVENNPDYTFNMVFEETRRGNNHSGVADGNLYIIRDGIVYGFMQSEYFETDIYFVPEGTDEADYAQVVEDRIKEYVDNSQITVDVSNYNEDDAFLTKYRSEDGELVGLLGITGKEYYEKFGLNKEDVLSLISEYEDTTYLEDREYPLYTKTYILTLNDNVYTIGIAQATTKKLEFGVTQSVDKQTGIMVRTKSSNVPLDAKIYVSSLNITDEQKEILKNNGYSAVKGFDFSLYSSILDSVISKFNDVTEVLIPVGSTEYNNLKSIYIDETTKKIEVYNIDIVTINGNKYYSFKTGHFSNYILAQAIDSNQESTPNTYDGIYKDVFVLLGSSIMLVGSIVLAKKQKIIK